MQEIKITRAQTLKEKPESSTLVFGKYEQAGQNGKTDIFCPMYYDYGGCDKYSQGDNPRPLIQCEYAHAMGNSMG